MRFVILFFWAATFSGFAQSLLVGPTPTWVEPVAYSVTPYDSSAASGGYFDLLTDHQVNLTTQENFYRYAQVVMSETGLGSTSAISQSFDPTYQQLTFHSLYIIREGKKIDKLKRDRFELIRREENLERAMYDGRVTAFYNLADVQVGDIVEYSLTLKGFNPLVPKYARPFYFNYGVPVGKVFFRLAAKPATPLQIVPKQGAEAPVISEKSGLKFYTWQLENEPALLVDEGTPEWIDPYKRVEISEYANWSDVAAWGASVYANVYQESPDITKKITELAKEKNKDSAINECIRFVQDEIRYLGFSDGINGYKPHKANEIFANRFGDCKDKSVLLSLMLRKLGLESHAVLVNTTTGKSLNDVLPRHNAFDHCIVNFVWNDSTYWVDPTMSSQRGALNGRVTPDYGYGLPLHSSTKELIEIPYRIKHSEIRVKEFYKVHTIPTSATLNVEVRYTGDEANSQRSYFQNTSIQEVSKNYLNFYANDFQSIEALKPVSFEDNEAENIFTTHESYRIKSFWSYDSATAKHSATIYPRTLASYLTKPGTKIRTMPFRLAYPRNVAYEVKIKMPEGWAVTEKNETIESAGFSYTSRWAYSGQDSTITMDLSYRTKKQQVEANEVEDYIKKIDATFDDLSMVLTYGEGKETAVSSKAVTPLFFILFVVGAGLVLLAKLPSYNPEPKPAPEKYSQIGGWLVLPAIGLCISPITLIVDLVKGDYFKLDFYALIIDSTSAAYNPALGLFVLVEFFINAAELAFIGVLILYFFQRRTSTPLLMAFLYIFTFVFVTGDALIATYWFNVGDITPKEVSTMFRQLIAAAIWVPYFLVSERVKGTFTVMQSNIFTFRR